MLTESVRVRTTAWSFIAVLLLSGALSVISRPESTARGFVTDHRPKIEDIAVKNQIAPQALAAVIQTAIDETELWKPTLEEGLMAAWITDDKSHFIFSKSLDISIGNAQIKPSTLQTAMMIKDKCEKRMRGDTAEYYPWRVKEYRDAPKPNEYWNLDATHCMRPEHPFSRFQDPQSKTVGKHDVLRKLFDDDGAIEAAGFILGLYAAQWQQAGYDIHDNPAILGTLYQNGFQHSRPHGNPVPNAFGRKAALVAAYHH